MFLVLVFAVPAFAVTADEQSDTLKSGWGGSYAPSGYTSSWFWRVVSELSDISDDIYQIRVDINTIDSRVLSIQSNVSGLVTTVQNISGKIDTLSGYLLNIKTDVTSIDTELSLIGNDVEDILPEVISIDATTSAISSNLTDVKSKVTDIELNTDYLKTIDADTSNLSDLSTSLQSGSWLTSGSSVNWFKVLFNATSSINTNVSKLASLYATDTDFQIKQSQADEEQAVLGALQSSNRVDDISGLSGFSGDMKDFFAMDDVDIGLMFGQVESGYSSWFSMNTARALAVGGGASAVSGAVAATYGLDRAAYEEPETPYLDASNAEVASILAGGNP